MVIFGLIRFKLVKENFLAYEEVGKMWSFQGIILELMTSDCVCLGNALKNMAVVDTSSFADGYVSVDSSLYLRDLMEVESEQLSFK